MRHTCPVSDLDALGWDPEWAAAFAPYAPHRLKAARVVCEERGEWRVALDGEERIVRVSGGFRHKAGPTGLPAVGDWVAVKLPKHGKGQVHAVLKRRSLFLRKAVGQARPQVVAANVDTALLMMGLDGDFNPRRLERYLAAAYDSGAEPVVVLNKLDLEPEWEELAAELEEVCSDTPVAAISALDGEIEALAPYLVPGRTICLLGSSGVGKSTLLNLLAGEDLQKVAEVRESDERGRHTTTRRELFALEGGTLVIDTPGMRELQLWEAEDGLNAAFADIAALAASCHFRDCEHRTEPDCAVLAALESEELDPERFESWTKLKLELQGLVESRPRRRGHASRSPSRK